MGGGGWEGGSGRGRGGLGGYEGKGSLLNFSFHLFHENTQFIREIKVIFFVLK